MNVLEILKAKLIEIGADGLCTNGCGCRIEDGLAPCDSYFGRCVPAKQVTVDEARTRSDLESVDIAMDAEQCGGFFMLDLVIYKQWKGIAE